MFLRYFRSSGLFNQKHFQNQKHFKSKTLQNKKHFEKNAVTFPEFEFVLPEFSARPDVVSGKFREIWPKFSPTRGNTLENPGNTHVIIYGTNSGHVMYLRDLIFSELHANRTRTYTEASADGGQGLDPLYYYSSLHI